MFVVVAYDIVNNRRRARVANELENFGQRVQLSVFECYLNGSELQELAGRLARLIDYSRDKIYYYRLCRKDRGLVRTDGAGDVIRDVDFYVI